MENRNHVCTGWQVQCLWTEAVPLYELGRLHIQRASTIEFNSTSRHWQVKDLRGRVRFFAKSRLPSLDSEQQDPD